MRGPAAVVGEPGEDLLPALIAALALGAVQLVGTTSRLRLLLTGEPVDEAFIEHIVNTVVDGVTPRRDRK